MIVFFAVLFGYARSLAVYIPMQKASGGIHAAAIAPASKPSLPALAGVNPAETKVIEPPGTSSDEPETQAASPEKTNAGDDTSAAQSESYIVVPRFYNLSVSEAKAYFAGYGIDAQTENDNVAPDRIVTKVSFFGKWDDDNFYIKPDRQVILKVGADKKPTGDSGKIAYLTFDDGPTWYNTPRILDILENYGIKATFFVVGKSIERFPKRLKEIYDSGNAIGCHSYSHAYSKIYSSADAFHADMQRWHDAVSGELGEDFACSLYRMPGGTLTARKFADYDAIREALADRGFRIFDWNMSNNDVWSRTKAGGLSPVEYEKQCFEEQLRQLDGTGRLLIILMHETYSSTVDMLPWAIELLIDKGYAFDTLDNFSGEFLH